MRVFLETLGLVGLVGGVTLLWLQLAAADWPMPVGAAVAGVTLAALAAGGVALGGYLDRRWPR